MHSLACVRKNLPHRVGKEVEAHVLMIQQWGTQQRENQNNLSSTSSALCWISRSGTGGLAELQKTVSPRLPFSNAHFRFSSEHTEKKDTKRVYLCLCTHSSSSRNCSGFNSHDYWVSKPVSCQQKGQNSCDNDFSQLTCQWVGFLSCWLRWGSCSGAPQLCPLTGHLSRLVSVWTLHGTLLLGLLLGLLLLWPRLARGS